MISIETSEQAAQRLAAKPREAGYSWQALHTYTDCLGVPVYWRIRLKHLATGKKWIRPLSWDGKQYVLKEPTFPEGKPLYRLHELMDRKDESVFVVEGEWCVDHLAGIGILATTSGSADSVDKTDWQPLTGRQVTIWPDNDLAGERYALAVAETLSRFDCHVSVIDVSSLSLPAKGDAVDWLAQNSNATSAEVLALQTIAPAISSVTNEIALDEDKDKTSQASKLVAFVEEHSILFHDPNGEVFASECCTGETRRIDSRVFRDWLSAGFYEATGKAVRDQSVREALSTLAGRGRIHGECHEVYIRVAVHGGDYYLDLAEPGQSRAVLITAGRWEVVSNPPVRFLRTNTMKPLPLPQAGGSLAPLWQIANIPLECRLLVLAWLCECLRPDTPFPVMELIGEQGSAKSTTQAALRKLFDPNTCDLRAAPKSVEDVFVGAGANWLVSYENISHLSAPMQDALCTLATGGGFAKRKLYSDADESVITVKRPVVLNGISVAVTAQDLVDRTVSVELPTITERQEITALLEIFENEHGSLLGALLDLMVKAMQLLPETQLPKADRPRLTEFARLGVALEKAGGCPPESFMSQFNARREEAIARTIDASPVASAVVEWFQKNKCSRTQSVKEWLDTLDYFKPAYCDAWPKSPKGLGDALRRAAPALRQMGIECSALPRSSGVYRWEFKPREKSWNPCPESPACPDDELAEQDFRTFRTSVS